MNLNIRQGTNEAWFIYNDNKVILGSHDKELIEKVFSFLIRCCKFIFYITFGSKKGAAFQAKKKISAKVPIMLLVLNVKNRFR